MSENKYDNRKRRYIYITDKNYADVAKAAVKLNLNNWEVIDKALTAFFKQQQEDR